jgi:hypothetical protein
LDGRVVATRAEILPEVGGALNGAGVGRIA